MQQGRWQWLALAAGLQLSYFVMLTLVYQVAFTAVGVSSQFKNLLPLTFAAIFINSTAPSGGAAGVAVYVDDARQHGQSTTRTAVGTLLVLIADFGSFLMILAAGLIILFSRHNLQSYEFGAGIIMFLYVGGMALLLALGLWRPVALRRLLVKVQHGVNRVGQVIRRPMLLSEDWSAYQADEFEESAQLMAARPLLLGVTVGLALTGHAIELAALTAVFHAFSVPASLAVVVVGYAITMLFWIVSPTPNGIGVVEGLVPLVYVSLGVPAAEAALITLSFRGLAFWIPFLVGFVLLRRLPMFTSKERSLAYLGHVRVIAFLTAVMGVLNIVSAMTPALADRAALLGRYSPLAVTRGGNLTAVLAGFGLLLLSYGLAKRKQAAWFLTMTLLLVSVVSHLVKGLDYEEAALSLLLALYLFWQRAHFQGRSDPPSLRRAIWLIPASLLFTLLYGAIGFYLLDRHFSVNFSLDAAIRQTMIMFTQFYDPGLQPITGFGRYFAASIYIVGFLTIGLALLLVLRSVIIREPATEAQRAKAQAIVTQYGRSSLARFLLFSDKSYWFSAGGSVVGFVVKNSLAVALGDPIGPTEDGPSSITGFRDYCQKQGWPLAFYQTQPDYLAAYQAAGFEAIRTGHEAIIDLHSFTLAGKDGKQFRTAVNRMNRIGVRAEIVTPPLPSLLLAQLRDVSDEWLALMHGQEKQFSLGWFHDEYIGSSTVVVVYDELERVSAFANINPEYAKNEVTLDLMRRRNQVENGTMEFLFAVLLPWCQEQGFDTFNLGLSSLSGVGEEPEDPLAEKAMHYVYDHVNQYYNFQGLHAFKEKFRPTWEPRYIVFPNYATLPGVWAALALASSGDRYLIGNLRDLPPTLKRMARLVNERYQQRHKENENKTPSQTISVD